MSARPADVRPWNPLFTHQSVRHAHRVAAWDGSGLVLPLHEESTASLELACQHTKLQRLILGDGYPCVGARAVLNQKNYWLGAYAALGSAEAIRTVCEHIYEFNHRFPASSRGFVSFLASFDGPSILSEHHFEQLLWKQLQAMHDLDRKFFPWDSTVSDDPANPDFSFSIGGRAFFIIGMHRHASRKARTFDRPMLVFNAHEQFEALRARGKFAMMRNIIRSRDIAYQGAMNPVLQDHGEASEARQYSGRAVSPDWVCPFHAKKGNAR